MIRDTTCGTTCNIQVIRVQREKRGKGTDETTLRNKGKNFSKFHKTI